MHQEQTKAIELMPEATVSGSVAQVSPSWHYYATLAILGVLLGLFFREAYIGAAIYPVQVGIARLTASLLSFFDIQVIQQGTVLMHRSGFACEITPGCTGLISVMMYSTAVLLYPARVSHKITGLVIGVICLIVLNFVRLVHLVYVGAHHIAWFDVTHEVFWQSFLALAVVAAWWLWTAWSRRQS